MSNIPFVGLAVLWSFAAAAAAAADVDDEVEAVDDADDILLLVVLLDWILDSFRGVSTTLDDPTPL